MGLDVNLLFRVLQDWGCSKDGSGMVCLAFGALIYLAALSAQGISLRELLGVQKKGVCQRSGTW